MSYTYIFRQNLSSLHTQIKTPRGASCCISMEAVELRVRLHCKSCEKTVRKALCKIKGVKCVQIDNVSNRITVMGYMERKVVVKTVWKTGIRAELLPSSHHLDLPSPRLSTGFRCIIPKCSIY
ncbi:heavy metal-associated isoprenylated plant protein 28-like [Mercurialis annua]|uniref:heavy metal-associated isoprenylated plant protein 28-like n=1 Tax=Mercurialis annua TaxID=3986 RepID=UPI00215E3F9B|nr:heavy metal-associated isoprenylated plant protein 28-like [Mercurialis annua]